MYRQLSIFCVIFFLASCADNQAKVKVDPKNIHEERNVSCPIIQSEKWHAWIDKFTQKKDSKRLIVVGEIVLPTPGFTVAWKQGATDRQYVPSKNSNTG